MMLPNNFTLFLTPSHTVSLSKYSREDATAQCALDKKHGLREKPSHYLLWC